MIPSHYRRRSDSRSGSNESSWMLLPRRNVYLGALGFFLLGFLCSSGWNTSAPTGISRLTNLSPHQHNMALEDRETVLVTGGLGFIGSHVVEDLVENGYHVVVLDDMSNGKNFNKIASALLLKDITVTDDYQAITMPIDYVIHLAAAISVTESLKLPEKYERVNVEGSRKILEWAKQHKVKRVVAASSAATYGIPRPENIPLREEIATGGICPYAMTKFKMEKLLDEYATLHRLPTTALRFFNVFGPRQDPKSEYSGVISWFMDQAVMNGTLHILGDGEQYRDFVYVKDVARALRIAMLLEDPSFDVFNVCTGVKTSINTLAEEVIRAFSSTAKKSYETPRPGDIKESLCSPVKSSQKLGFTSSYSFKEGITQTRDWFRSQNTA